MKSNGRCYKITKVPVHRGVDSSATCTHKLVDKKGRLDQRNVSVIRLAD